MRKDFKYLLHLSVDKLKKMQTEISRNKKLRMSSVNRGGEVYVIAVFSAQGNNALFRSIPLYAV